MRACARHFRWRSTGQAIAREVYLDASQPTIHLVPEGMPGYNSDLTDAAGRKGKDALTPDIPAAQALLKSYVADKRRGQLCLMSIGRSFCTQR